MTNNKKYILNKDNMDDYRIINQNGVKQTIIDEPNHNAAWDGFLAKDGTFYFSACSEHTNHEFAKLYKYDFDTNTATQCFYTRDFLLKSERYLRDSKFHTSISEKTDGKLIMCTHSTDKSPCHPVWLPLQFVSNPFEGFPGGELMEYDPKTGKIELFGIPAPRETIYGGVYSPKDDAYYMLGWMRGHLYRFDCKTRKCEDKGQVSEYRSYRIVLGPDGNVYFSTKSGFMMRYNVETQKLEDLNARIPSDKVLKGRKRPFCYLGPCVTGPDGRLYLTGNNTSFLSALDVKTGEIEVIGDLFPAEDYTYVRDQNTFSAGMDFDKDGVLWYSSMSFRVKEDEHFKVPSGLFRWDFLHGKEPEFLGLFGTAERVQTYTDSLYIDKEKDILYSASTNHSYGSPDIIAIDLKEYRKNMYERGEVCRDMLVFEPGYDEYKPFADHWENVKDLIAEYSPNIKGEKIEAVRLWREVEIDEILDTKVIGLKFTDEDTIEGLCGLNKFYRFVIKNGKLAEFNEANAEFISKMKKKEYEKIDNLPYYPGRQWRANVTAECDWIDGSKLIGTEDGFLAVVKADKSVYSLGPAICQGPVRDLCSNLEKKIAYGVGGDVEDIGNLFSYNESQGIRYLGVTTCDKADDNVGVCANFIQNAIAISENGEKVAIGAGDRLASVYIYTKPFI